MLIKIFYENPEKNKNMIHDTLLQYGIKNENWCHPKELL